MATPLALAPAGAAVVSARLPGEGGGSAPTGFFAAAPLVGYGGGAWPHTLGADSEEQAAELLARHAVVDGRGVAAVAWRASCVVKAQYRDGWQGRRRAFAEWAGGLSSRVELVDATGKAFFRVR